MRHPRQPSARVRDDVRNTLASVRRRSPVHGLSHVQLLGILTELDLATDKVVNLLQTYDTSDRSTAKFWTSAIIAGSGLVFLEATQSASLILTLLGGIHAVWCGHDLARDVYNEQIELALLEKIALEIDAVEAELDRRGL